MRLDEKAEGVRVPSASRVEQLPLGQSPTSECFSPKIHPIVLERGRVRVVDVPGFDA
jgi:hypothetical protein